MRGNTRTDNSPEEAESMTGGALLCAPGLMIRIAAGHRAGGG
jgi:hypothetical protein